MNPRSAGLVVVVGCLAFSLVRAGEIVIIQQVPEGSRTQQGAGYARDEARRQVGKPGIAPTTTNIIITDDRSQAPGVDRAEQSSRDAREYLSPPVPADTVSGDGTTVILRAAPSSEAERSRLRARSYVTPNKAARGRECSNATSQVGTIGEGPNAERGSVVERGTSSVSNYCK